jgi:hypothetical protein
MDIQITDEMIQDISEKEIAKIVRKLLVDFESRAFRSESQFRGVIEKVTRDIILEQYKDLIVQVTKELVPDTFSKLLADCLFYKLQHQSEDWTPESLDW